MCGSKCHSIIEWYSVPSTMHSKSKMFLTLLEFTSGPALLWCCNCFSSWGWRPCFGQFVCNQSTCLDTQNIRKVLEFQRNGWAIFFVKSMEPNTAPKRNGTNITWNGFGPGNWPSNAKCTDSATIGQGAWHVYDIDSNCLHNQKMLNIFGRHGGGNEIYQWPCWTHISWILVRSGPW